MNYRAQLETCLKATSETESVLEKAVEQLTAKRTVSEQAKQIVRQLEQQWENWVTQERSQQETLFKLKSPDQPSVMTAGDAKARDVQFEAHIAMLSKSENEFGMLSRTLTAERAKEVNASIEFLKAKEWFEIQMGLIGLRKQELATLTEVVKASAFLPPVPVEPDTEIPF